MGIPEDEQSKLFTRFFRSSTATERAIQGTGLGLTIVKAIVAMHGGRISVESVHQRGTTVTVSLPREQEQQVAVSSRDRLVRPRVTGPGRRAGHLRRRAPARCSPSR